MNKSSLFVALDVDDDTTALKFAKILQPAGCGFKIGPRLTYKYGAELTKKLAHYGPVFVDNKYHDIPSTVLAAIRSTFDSGASYATVHASNGPDCLREIAKLEKDLSAIRPFKILCVTVLTSFTDKNLPANWQKLNIEQHVLKLAEEISTAGLSGIVCSPHEAQVLRRQWPQAFLVTPGIRLPTDDKGDQARTMTPEQAFAAGASALVVGRPILSAADPLAAAKKVSDTFGASSASR